MDRPRCGSDSVLVDEQIRLFVADLSAFRIQIYQKQAIGLTPDQTAPSTEPVDSEQVLPRQPSPIAVSKAAPASTRYRICFPRRPFRNWPISGSDPDRLVRPAIIPPDPAAK